MNIRYLDLEIPNWTILLCLIPFLLIFSFLIGPNCHGFCGEEQAANIRGILYFSFFWVMILSVIGISIWQVVNFIGVMKGKDSRIKLPLDKPDGLIGLSATYIGVIILLLFLSIAISYGFGLWMLSIIIFPIVAISVGAFFLNHRHTKVRRKIILGQRGRFIDTDYISVEMDMKYSMNNRHPYQIISEGIHPKTHQKMIFYSDYIWMNPSEFVPKTIKVKVDPEDPYNYHVDLSFLKERLKDWNWDEIITEKLRLKE